MTDLAGKKNEIYDNRSVLIPGLVDLIDLGKHYKYYSVIELLKLRKAVTSRNKIMYSFFVLFCISFGQVICIIHSRQFCE